MMMARVMLIVLIVLLAACQGPEEPLPTLAEVDAILTDIAPSPTRTLPPTFTPTDTPTPEPTFTPVPTLALDDSANDPGWLYYIYNGDSIARITGEGQSSEIVVTFGVDQPISDLTISPDETLLAYVGPAGGGIREVYVSSLDGTYTQKISCLRYPDVREPLWTPDGQALVFLASATPNGPRDVYIANFIGSNECPTGNNQRLLVPLASANLRDLTISPDGERLFYSNGGIYLFYVHETVAPFQLTLPSGFGPDFSPKHSPVDNNRLFYLRSARDQTTGEQGGALVLLTDTTTIPEQPISLLGAPFYADRLVWKSDGTALYMASSDELWDVNPRNGSAGSLIKGLLMSPEIAASPVSSRVAFSASDSNGVHQIFVFDPDSASRQPITAHPEGTIADLHWIRTP
jgi:hypothetical protein